MEEKYYYNHLIVSALNLLKTQKNIKLSDVARDIGVNVKDIYNIRSHGRIAKEEDYLKIIEGFPEIDFDNVNVAQDHSIKYSSARDSLEKVISAQEKTIALLEEKINLLEKERGELKNKIEILNHKEHVK